MIKSNENVHWTTLRRERSNKKEPKYPIGAKNVYNSNKTSNIQNKLKICLLQLIFLPMVSPINIPDILKSSPVPNGIYCASRVCVNMDISAMCDVHISAGSYFEYCRLSCTFIENTQFGYVWGSGCSLHSVWVVNCVTVWMKWVHFNNKMKNKWIKWTHIKCETIGIQRILDCKIKCDFQLKA